MAADTDSQSHYIAVSLIGLRLERNARLAGAPVLKRTVKDKYLGKACGRILRPE